MAPRQLVNTAWPGKYSQVGTCLRAAALMTISTFHIGFLECSFSLVKGKDRYGKRINGINTPDPGHLIADISGQQIKWQVKQIRVQLASAIIAAGFNYRLTFILKWFNPANVNIDMRARTIPYVAETSMPKPNRGKVSSSIPNDTGNQSFNQIISNGYLSQQNVYLL